MPDISAPVPEGYDSDRGILDSTQHRLERGIYIAQQNAGHVRGRGQHQTFRDQELLAACLA
jgi:hypothetical protein